MDQRPLLPIPIPAARTVADVYGYDQVVIIARRVGNAPDVNGEHVTTYGVDAVHCNVAARIGRTLQRFMQWPLEPDVDPVVKSLAAAVMALRSYQHGNAAPDLAASIADAGEEALRAVGFPPGFMATKP